jgi:hypothetical protein
VPWANWHDAALVVCQFRDGHCLLIHRGSGQSALVIFYRKIQSKLQPMTKTHVFRWDIKLAICKLLSQKFAALAMTTVRWKRTRSTQIRKTLTHPGYITLFISPIEFFSDHFHHQRQLSSHNPKFVLFKPAQCQIVQSPASLMTASNHFSKMAAKSTSTS